MTTDQALKKVRVAMMNAVHDLPLLVARDEGFFADEGLDVEIVTTPGTAQAGADHRALQFTISERTMEALYDEGGVDQFRMCEWGVMKRIVEAEPQGRRPAKIVALGSAMSSFAIAVKADSGIYEPEQLKDTPVAVSPYNGSHFTTLKLLEGFVAREYVKTTFEGTMFERLQALRNGDVAAVSLMEPWISVAEKEGFRLLMESRSSRSEAAGDELDGPTLAAMFRAEARAAAVINQDASPYFHYLVDEAGGRLEAKDLSTRRLLNAPPAPYTRERFDYTYNWTLGWGLVTPGASYEEAVDNRAWE